MLKKINFKRWLSVLLAAIFVVPVVLSLFGVISIRNVLTDSMSPRIQPGDVVVSANWIKPSLNDVAIYHQKSIDGTMTQDVVHRVITRTAEGVYQFKGDHNATMDALSVPSSDVVGTVVLKIPGLGNLLNFTGFIFLVLIVGGIWLLVYGIKKLRQ